MRKVVMATLAPGAFTLLALLTVLTVAGCNDDKPAAKPATSAPAATHAATASPTPPAKAPAPGGW